MFNVVDWVGCLFSSDHRLTIPTNRSRIIVSFYFPLYTVLRPKRYDYSTQPIIRLLLLQCTVNVTGHTTIQNPSDPDALRVGPGLLARASSSCCLPSMAPKSIQSICTFSLQYVVLPDRGPNRRVVRCPLPAVQYDVRRIEPSEATTRLGLRSVLTLDTAV